eukprot:9543388-Alexandrium_andersonii.AAC.1
MSASLVGSEMCIRDRPQNRSQKLRRGAFCVVVRADADSADETGRRARQTVSYTHLTLPTICSV